MKLGFFLSAWPAAAKRTWRFGRSISPTIPSSATAPAASLCPSSAGGVHIYSSDSEFDRKIRHTASVD